MLFGGLLLRRTVGGERVGRELLVERRHRAGLEMALARAHQDHGRRGDHGAAVVGTRRTAHRIGCLVVVEESFSSPQRGETN